MSALGKRWHTRKAILISAARMYFRFTPLRFRRLALCIVLLAPGAPGARSAEQMNGFELSGALVPAEQIYSGGPAKDGIPAIDSPKFVSGEFANFLSDQDSILAISRGGISRAYPVRILNWHEVVNDRFDDEAVVITFCPLCGTGVAFDARIDGRVLSFGVSGLLYNSDVLLYDRQTQSLWSQLLGQAISGPMKGQHLKMLPLTHTTWADWRARHAATEVLSPDTGQPRPYARDPYAGYASSAEIMFPVTFRSAGFHPKERVLGIRIGDQAKAYPFVELGKTTGVVSDRIDDTALTIRFDRAASSATAYTADGKQLAAVVGYWFAWYTFNPKTAVFRAEVRPSPKRGR